MGIRFTGSEGRNATARRSLREAPMAATSRTVNGSTIARGRNAGLVGIAMAVVVVALVGVGVAALSRSTSMLPSVAPVAPGLSFSHGASGDGIGADLPATVQPHGSIQNLLRAELPIAAATTTTHGSKRVLLRAENPDDAGALNAGSPRSVPTR